MTRFAIDSQILELTPYLRPLGTILKLKFRT
jgi:hypothetical protein